jgi:hypothetical protein
MAYKATKYNTAFTLIFPMVKKGLGDFAVAADWTPAVGDCKFSTNAGAGANTTNLPVALSGIKLWKLDVLAGEVTSQVTGIVISHQTSPKAVEDNAILLETYGNAAAAIVRDLGALVQQADVEQWLATPVAAPTVAGVPTVTLANPAGWQKNSTVTDWMFFMADATTGLPKLGATVVVQKRLSGSGVDFANVTNSPAIEISGGWYRITLAPADTNADRAAFKCTATGATQVNVFVEFEPI